MIRENLGKTIRIGILHSNLSNIGGTVFVCLNFIEALQEEYEVTVITNEAFDVKSKNAEFSLDLSRKDFNIITPDLPLNIGERTGYKPVLLRTYLRHNSEKFDLLISTRNLANFGEKGIQYLHSIGAKDIPKTASASLSRQVLGKSPFQRLYSWYQKRGAKRNLTICNSHFTRRRFQKRYDTPSIVVYPPVKSDFPSKNWEKRENGFVCLGRIGVSKRQLFIIKIIDALKNRGHNIHLHVIGEPSNKNYYEKVRKAISQREYVFYEGTPSHEEMAEIISNHKFGIHGFIKEDFGISIAEMINAGSIPFAHNSGGPKEILGDKKLLYNGFQDAVRKIERIIRDQELQDTIRAKLAKKRLNTPEDFQRKIRKIVGIYTSVRRDR